jgi:hypothetical protein
MNNRTSAARRRIAIPWPAHLAVSVAALAVLVAAYCRLWPRGDSQLSTGAAALLVLAAAALVWAAKSVSVLRRERRWSWWIAAFPAAATGAAVVAAMAAPAFEDALPQFDQAATRLLSDPTGTTGELRLGRFDIDHAIALEGQAFFIDDRALNSGWVYSPDGEPHRAHGTLTYKHITGDWYSFDYAYDDPTWSQPVSASPAYREGYPQKAGSPVLRWSSRSCTRGVGSTGG